MKSTKQHAFRFLAVCAIALSCTFATTVAAEPSRDGQTDPSSASTQIVQVSEILLGPYSPRAISTWKLRLSKEFEIGIEKIIDWLDPAKGNQITEQPDPVDLKTPEDRSVDPPLTAGSDSQGNGRLADDRAPVTLAGWMELPVGGYYLRAYLRNTEDGRGGMIETAVEVATVRSED